MHIDTLYRRYRLQHADVRKNAYSRFYTHRRRTSYLPSLPALLSNMPGMLLPNMPSAKWSVKIPAGLSDFTRARAFSFFRTRRDRSERTAPSWKERGDGWGRDGTIRARNVEPSILKRSWITVTFESGARVVLCYYSEPGKITNREAHERRGIFTDGTLLASKISKLARD